MHFVVTGVPGAGHRFMCQLLEACGLRGNAVQPGKIADAIAGRDDYLFTHEPEVILPALLDAHKSPTVILLLREYFAHRKQCREVQKMDAVTFTNRRLAIPEYCLKKARVCNLPIEVVAYESHGDKADRLLLRRLGLKLSGPLPKFFCANEKHY